MSNRVDCRHQLWYSLTGVTLALTLITLPVRAANTRLDNADAHLRKAAALLKAAARTGERRTVRTHRERAIRLVEQAQREIGLAQRAADLPIDGTHAIPHPNPRVVPHLRAPSAPEGLRTQ